MQLFFVVVHFQQDFFVFPDPVMAHQIHPDGDLVFCEHFLSVHIQLQKPGIHRPHLHRHTVVPEIVHPGFQDPHKLPVHKQQPLLVFGDFLHSAGFVDDQPLQYKVGQIRRHHRIGFVCHAYRVGFVFIPENMSAAGKNRLEIAVPVHQRILMIFHIHHQYPGSKINVLQQFVRIGLQPQDLAENGMLFDFSVSPDIIFSGIQHPCKFPVFEIQPSLVFVHNHF